MIWRVSIGRACLVDYRTAETCLTSSVWYAAPRHLRGLFSLAIAVLAMGNAVAAGNPDLAAVGQRIYQEGVLPSGEPLVGLAQSGVSRTGKEAACIACHRRSGFGTAEGKYVIRPINGPTLFQSQMVVAPSPRLAHWLGAPVRPAYDDRALARAIRDGVDVTGRRLDPLMPRYPLREDESTALIAYLKGLSAVPSPGVTDEEIHLATVIQPRVSSTDRRAMLDVLEAFVKDKNAGTRSEEHRREAGTMRMHRAYRRWVLHAWELVGPDDSWSGQLESLYRAQPVFAMVSGAGTSSWKPVHEFSERFGIPCILPQTDLPAVSGPGIYTLYLSRGVMLEADVLAKYLDDTRHGERIVQVYRNDESSLAAAREFRAAVNPASRLDEHLLDGPAAENFWQRLFAESDGATVVLWLPAEDLIQFDTSYAKAKPDPAVFLSATFLGRSTVLHSLLDRERVRLVYPDDVPLHREARLLRSKLWLRSKGLALVNEKLQINTLFAASVTGGVLSHMMDSFSRDYFVERAEHEVNSALIPSIYPHVSLGPDQRFASKGSYIVQAVGREQRDLKPVSGWIVP